MCVQYLKILLSFCSTNFFKDNCSLQVRIVQLVSTVDEESKKTKLEAHIEFRSNQELKLARKLNGHLMGKSRIFFDRTLGRYLIFCVIFHLKILAVQNLIYNCGGQLTCVFHLWIQP